MRITELSDDPEFAKQMDRKQWPHLKQRLTEVFLEKSQAEWCALMEATDVCFAPVLTMSEAAQHPHNVQRSTFVNHHGVTQPAPAPRFSRTSSELTLAPAHAGQHSREVLERSGFDDRSIAALLESGAVKQA